MKKISGSTFYFKKVFPSIWFGFLAIFVFTIDTDGVFENITIIAAPIFMIVFGFMAFKKIFWDLADEVIDEGQSLLFKKGALEQRVQLKDIINISHSNMNSPERVVIQTRTNGPIGKELAFTPPIRLNPFSKDSTITLLIERVDNARNT